MADVFRPPLLVRYRGAEPAVSLRTWTQSSTFVLLYDVHTIPVGKSTEWAVPRGYRPVIELRTWEWTSEFLTSFGVHVQPKRVHEWPNPRGNKYPVRDWTYTPATIFYPVATKPFSQNSWPNPNIQVRGNQSWTSTSALISYPAKPLSQNDWPNPNLQQRSRQGWSSVPATIFYPPVVSSNPFSQPEWPNPVAKLRREYGFVQEQRLLLYPSLTIYPPNAFEWPNPNRAQSRQIGGSFVPASIFYPVAAVGSPWFQVNWPNPRGSRPLVSLGFVQASILNPPEENPHRGKRRIKGSVTRGTRGRTISGRLF